MNRVFAALLSGALFYFSLGLHPFWLAAWLAPIPILVAAFYSESWRQAAGLTYLAIAIGISSNFNYYLKTTGNIATPILLLLQILVWGFFILRSRSAVRSSNSWLIVFVYPLVETGVSALVSFFSPHGTWGSYVYTQMDALPVIQIASVMGAAAVVFLVGLFSSAAAVAIYKGRNIDRPWLGYGLPALLLAGGIGFGVTRLYLAPVEPTMRIGVASVDDFIGPRIPQKLVSNVWDQYATMVADLARQGAKIVLLPEKITKLSGEEITQRQQQLAQLAHANNVYLAAGLQLNRPAEKDNVLWLLSPSGKLIAEYHKQQLVPHLEGDLTPGKQNMVRTIDGVPFGLAICRDLIFADLGRSYGKLGVSVMLVPAWDFYVDAWMASSVGALRGVENGYAVVRDGRESYLNVSDRYGRTIARKRSDFLPGTSLLADVPVGPPQLTFFARFGNWFARLSILGMIAVLFPSWLKATWETLRQVRR